MGGKQQRDSSSLSCRQGRAMAPRVERTTTTATEGEGDARLMLRHTVVPMKTVEVTRVDTISASVPALTARPSMSHMQRTA